MNKTLHLKQLLERYEPWDKQEIQDKKVMLRYLNQMDDVLTRENELIHFTASSWIFNPTHDKVLMIYHNIYDSWGWVGGHADGDGDLLNVAKKEAQEETGIKKFHVLSEELLGIDILPVWHHQKKGNMISSHLHANLTYLFEADESQPLMNKPDENQGVKWIAIDEIDTYVSEPDMISVYHKLNQKAQVLLQAQLENIVD